MNKAFTLVELIVVIIIVGILAAVGMSQYSKMVEKGRSAEAKMILGQIRKLAYEYRLEHGTITGITNADLSIGGAANQIPSGCRSTHYFFYGLRPNYTDPEIEVGAWRCNAGGKSPQGDPSWSCMEVALRSNLAAGGDNWCTHSCSNCPSP